jgi:signal transduction histidine kinase
MQTSLSKNPALKWLFIFALWTLVGLGAAGQLYLTQSKIGVPVSWRFALEKSLANWYVFAVLSVPTVWLAGRVRWERGRRVQAALAYLSASVVFSLAWMALRASIEQWQSRQSANPVSFSAAFSQALVATFFFNWLIYWVIVGVSQTADVYRQFQEREVRAAELEKRLVEAKLQALQMQLNPHFLFNTLHAISALMHKDVEAADRMITRLSDLLRLALDSSDTQEVPLREELAFLERYLEIEQTRFGERLKVKMEIGPETSGALVPSLILQPLVENAIRHGIEPQALAGVVRLSACCEGGQLRLRVSDNGVGLRAGQPVTEGVGLSNTRARLQQLYGAAHQFHLSNGADGGLAVDIVMPLRRAAPDGSKT